MQFLRGTLGRNTLALMVSNSGSMVLSFLLTVLIGRVLGESGLGTYATVLAWIFPLSLVTEFGLGTLITRDVAREPDQAQGYLVAAVKARLMIGGLLMLAVWLAAPFLSANEVVVSGLRLSTPLIVILPLYGSFTAIFRAHERMKPIADLNLGMLIAQVGLTNGALLLNGTILDVLAINVLTSAGQLVCAWIVYRTQFHTMQTKRIAVLALLRSSAQFAIAAILAATQARLNIIVLEQLMSINEVGYYAAAMRFVEAGRLIPHAFFDALFPRLAALAADPHALAGYFRRVMVGLIGFGIVAAIGLTLIAEPMITLIFGERFAPAAPTLVILGWSLLPLLMKSGRTLYWYALGKEGFVNLTTGFVIVIQLGLVWVLVPRFGVPGAALAVLASEATAAAILFSRRA